ncbi:hypothetical protein TYRP_022751 [Tyrophagus putrescentiae]|nr:hypothetical protein TYRP_022751 [Tyrophagus putrescentiae]
MPWWKKATESLATLREDSQGLAPLQHHHRNAAVLGRGGGRSGAVLAHCLAEGDADLLQSGKTALQVKELQRVLVDRTVDGEEEGAHRGQGGQRSANEAGMLLTPVHVVLFEESAIVVGVRLVQVGDPRHLQHLEVPQSGQRLEEARIVGMSADSRTLRVQQMDAHLSQIDQLWQRQVGHVVAVGDVEADEGHLQCWGARSGGQLRTARGAAEDVLAQEANALSHTAISGGEAERGGAVQRRHQKEKRLFSVLHVPDLQAKEVGQSGEETLKGGEFVAFIDGAVIQPADVVQVVSVEHQRAAIAPGVPVEAVQSAAGAAQLQALEEGQLGGEEHQEAVVGELEEVGRLPMLLLLSFVRLNCQKAIKESYKFGQQVGQLKKVQEDLDCKRLEKASERGQKAQ